MIVLVNSVEIDADSRATATVNRNGRCLTPWKQDSFQRELHEVLSRQQFHFRRASKHRVLGRSADPRRRTHQRGDGVLHRSHRHQRSSMEHEQILLTPSTRRQPDEGATSASRTTAAQRRVRANEWSLRGCPTPTGSRSRRSAGRHTKLTVKRPPPHTCESKHLHCHANHAGKELAL